MSVGGGAIKKFLNRFSAWALALATIGGLYLSALALDLTVAFWVLMIAAVIVAVVPVGWRKAVDVTVRLRDYTSLKEKLASAESRCEALEASLAEAQETIVAARRDGRAEGLDQMRGSMLSVMADLPTVVAAVNFNGSVALAAKCNSDDGPAPGSRYFVIEQITGEVKGVVQIVQPDESGDASNLPIILGVIEPKVEKFWKQLADRVELDTSPPTSVTLRRYSPHARIDDGNRLIDHSNYLMMESRDNLGTASDDQEGR